MTKKKKLVLFTSITAAILAVVLVLTLCLTLIDRGDGQDPIAQYSLNVLTDGGGTASVVDVKDEYSADSEVQVVATPNEGWHFDGWFSSKYYKLSSNPTYTFNIKENTTLHAQFSENFDATSNRGQSESTELLDCANNMAIVVHCAQGEDYIRENLFIYDNYFLDDNNNVVPGYEEYATVPIGDIVAHGNNYYLVHPIEEYDYGSSYVVKSTGDVSILKNTTELVNSQTRKASVGDLLQGVQETGTSEVGFMVDNYEHEDIELKDNVYIYSFRDNPNVNESESNIDGWVIERIGDGHTNEENGQGGFITTSITFPKNNRTVTLKPGDIVGFGGELVRKDDLKVKDFDNSLFGVIKEIHILGDSEYTVYFVELVSVEDEDEVFTVLDVYVEEDLDLEKYVDPDDPELQSAIVNELYKNESFQKLVAGFLVASNDYAEENGYDGSDILIKSIKDDLKIKPIIDFKDGYLVAGIDISLKINLLPKNPIGANMTLSLEAKLVERLHLKLSFSWVKGALGIKKGFDFELQEDDRTEFTFEVKVQYGLHPGTYKYTLDKGSKTVHNAHCMLAEQLDVSEPSNKILQDLIDDGYTPCPLCLGGDLADKIDQEGEMSTKEFREHLDDILAFENLQWVMNKVKDSLVKNKQEDTQTGVTLFEFTTGGLVRFKVRISFQLHLTLEASVRYDYAFEHHSIQGVRVTVDGCDTYKGEKDKYAQMNELTLLGKIEAKVGFRLDVGVADCLGILQFGLYGEAGAYFNLTGAAKIAGTGEDFTAAYMELGLYLDFGVTYKVFYVIKGEKPIVQLRLPLLQMGHDKAIYGYVYNIDEVMLKATEDKKTFSLDELGVLDVRTMDVKKLTYNSEKLKLDEGKYVVDISLTDTTWFILDGRNIRLKDNAPLGMQLETTLILRISAEDRRWKDYVEGSPMVKLPTREIKLITMLNCTNHNYIRLAKEEPTCDAVGHDECLVCTHCRKVFDVNYNEIAERGTIAALGHDYQAIAAVPARCLETGMSAGTQCTRCGEYGVEPQVTEALGHNMNSNKWNTLRKATCELSGEDSHECDRCGLIIGYRIILPTGHTVNNHNVDCVDGVKCATCNKTLKEGPGHDYAETERIEPQCEKAGRVNLKCKHCNATSGYDLPATGHPARKDGDVIVSEKSYCTKDGELIYKCSACGKELKEVLKPVGHDMAAWHTDKAATCTEEGSESRTCKRSGCGYKETRAIHALGHVASATDPNTCGRCGLPMTSNHKSDHTTVTKGARPATCSAVGYTDGIWCEECQLWLVKPTEIAQNPNAHNMYDVAAKAPTCTEKGHTAYKQCHDCEKTENYEVIDAKGHTMKYWGATVTCTQAGTIEHYNCVVCDKNFADKAGKNELTNIHSDKSPKYHNLSYHAGAKCVLNAAGDGVVAGHNPYYTCSYCNKMYADAEAKTEYVNNGHVHTVNKSTKQEGSCTTFAIYTYTCGGDCGKFDIEMQYEDNVFYYENDVYYNHWLPESIHNGAECPFCYATLGLTYEYNEEEKSYTVTGIGRASNVKEIIVPNTYLGLPVKRIGDRAFRNSSVVSVTLPESVTSIGASAFSGCSNLLTINIDKVAEIGAYAFCSCQKLTNVRFSNTIKEIPSNGFVSCFALTSIELPEGVTIIREDAFATCGLLTEIIIPKSVVNIEREAFEYIGNMATFRYSGSTVDWIYGVNRNNVWWRGNSYIVACTDGNIHTDGSIEYPLTIKEENGGLTITGISGKYAECETNKVPYDVVVPSMLLLKNNGQTKPVLAIDVHAFQNLKYMRKLVLPDSVKNLADGLLYGCSGLEELTIPFVGDKARSVDEQNTRYHFGYIFGTDLQPYDGSIYIEGKYRKDGMTETGHYNIPTSLTRVTVLGGAVVQDSFGNYTTLRSITLGANISIGGFAFYSCRGLTSITILGNGTTTIGESAFSRCTNLASVTIGEGVISIGDRAFQYCEKLTNITIPSSVTQIGSNAFAYSGLTGVTIADGVTSIGKEAFKECSSLKSIIIPASLTNVDSNAFWKCDALTDVYYKGTAAGWAKITIDDSHNEKLQNATIHYI